MYIYVNISQIFEGFFSGRWKKFENPLSDNATYRSLWRDEKTRGYVVIATLSAISLKYILGL